MALIECPECGREVSTLAVSCPHCGFPMSGAFGSLGEPSSAKGPSRWTDPGFWIILAGLATVIALSVWMLARGLD